jgi:hypothetical protein
MRSPFPGMDPYIERYWEGAHARLIGYMADALATQLPDDLAARIEERVYIEADDHLAAVRRPDVRVVEDPLPWDARRAGGATATAEPVIRHLNVDPVTERHIQIMDMDGNRIVTAVELLSPANKVLGPGREQYLRKRKEFMASDANLVEIDLVRAGDWVRMLEPFTVAVPYQTTYRVSVWQSSDPGETKLYPIGLRQALPKISVPLRPNEPDAELELQPLLDRVYRLSRFDRIDYSKPCEPLSEEDALWAREQIAAASVKPS